MRAVRHFLAAINSVSDWTGKGLSLLVLPMVLILVWEVLLRYAFNSPTIWAHDIAGFLFGAYLILGGCYTLRWRAHVNIEVFYDRFPLKVQAITDLLTWVLFYVFCGLLLWEAGQAAWLSVERMENAASVWGPPIWPLKLTIPLAAALILFQGLTKTITDLYKAATGREFPLKGPTKKEEIGL